MLWAENVLARRYFYPGCHRMEPYRSYFPHARLLLPETERITGRVLTLPTGTGMDTETIGAVTALIRRAIDAGPQLTRDMEAAGVADADLSAPWPLSG